MSFNSKNRPADWPVNFREERLDCIWDKLDDFVNNPTYKTREVLLSYVNDNDLNQITGLGKLRFTEYEAQLINLIYARATQLQINSVKVYLYDLITEATRIQKILSWSVYAIEEVEKPDAYRIKPYEEILLLPLKLYYFVYQKYTVEKSKSFVEQLLEVTNIIYKDCQISSEKDQLAFGLSSMLNDISYMRGNKKERFWEFDRNELFQLFEAEAKIFKSAGISPVVRPTRGVLITQISNFILKSRNNYNQDYICKYLTKNAAQSSVENHEIWMRRTEDLNDEREQRVIPELFLEDDWIDYSWAKHIDFTPVRTYFVSSFSKTINASNMQNEYGDCIYGYKNDRIAELISPLLIKTFINNNVDASLPKQMRLPSISQALAFDIIYDRNEAKTELQYLFKVIDLFDMSEEEKHLFLQRILQYWILTVKDEKWKNERERRYVLFLYEDYDYLEAVVEDGFLKEKTSLFLLPDFVIGDNPVKPIIKREMEAKQKGTMTREYLHCHDCLLQDYDAVYGRFTTVKECPVCGSRNVEIIFPK